MSNQCNKCGSRNTATVNARDMADKTGDSSFITAASGTVNPILIVETLKVIFEFLGKLFGWLEEKEKNNRSVVVCKDCGYWERV
ncbi:MAG: hypothetical protein Q8L68_06960 [Methylococcales bacterium]|nr:hypothetical protein [Methylococcales bacterium]